MKKILFLFLFLAFCSAENSGVELSNEEDPLVETTIIQEEKSENSSVTTTSSSTTTTSTSTTTTIPFYKKVSSLTIVELNTSHPYFEEKDMRQALFCIMDRDNLAQIIQKRDGAYNSLIPPKFSEEESNIASEFDCNDKEFSESFKFVSELLKQNYEAEDWYENERCTFGDINCKLRNLTSKSTGINLSDSSKVISKTASCGAIESDISTSSLQIGSYAEKIGLNIFPRPLNCKIVDSQLMNSDSFNKEVKEEYVCEDNPIRISTVYVNNLYDFFNSITGVDKYCYGFNFSNYKNIEIDNLLAELEQDVNNLDIAMKIEKILIEEYVVFPLFTFGVDEIDDLIQEIERSEDGSDRKYELEQKLSLIVEPVEKFAMKIPFSDEY